MMPYGAFMELCLQLCEEFDCSMTSGMRTKLRNAAVGGHPESRHIVDDQKGGWAQDLVPNSRAMNGALVKAAHMLGLGAEDEGDHVHVQTPRRGAPAV